MAHSRNMSTV